MRIYLIGYMGSGKSTVGKGLAKKLKLSFIDMDHFIEERNFRSIPQIFAEEGEDGFRKIEQKALHELSEFDDVLIATGGGAPCFFNNVEVMNQTGLTVYLDGSPRILAERLKNSKTERPLIQGKTYPELVKFIGETLAKREQWYKQAKIVLPFDHDLSDEEVYQLVAPQLDI
ncbi:shikimate kinase [Roseimarinus sediminis]|uniref:shikimate kinase n=1 Tax=Roseimarinus sediminis TaxID=1610899 RepID=UPI003D1B0CD2